MVCESTEQSQPIPKMEGQTPIRFTSMRQKRLVKKTNKVTGFLGSQSRPIPITKDEVSRIMTQVEEGVDGPISSMTFEIGEQVRVADGHFAYFSGMVAEVDVERSRLKVAVSIFGRPTPVELEYNQVEKL